MGYLYLAAAFDGAGWSPIHHNTVQESLQAEIAAMVEPMKRALEADPDALVGQIIFQKDGYNMSRRTPGGLRPKAAAGAPPVLRLPGGYGGTAYGRLQPFADVGRGRSRF